MQVEVDAKCMQANFGGHTSPVSEILPHFCLPSKRPKLKIELAQKIHASSS